MPLVIKTTGLEQYAPGGNARVKLLNIGGPGVGKSLSAQSLVATPEGWRRFGDLRVGDLVIGADGGPTKVLGVYPQGVRPAYSITFNDGASVVADAEHLWAVRTATLRQSGHPAVVLTTQQMLDDGLRRERPDRKPGYRFYLPLVAPVQYDKLNDLPVSAYLLGTLLANGSFTSGSVVFATNDESVATRCIQENPQLDITEATYPTSTCRRWRIKAMHALLRTLDLDQLKSGAKFVPAAYMTAHEQVRRDLLAALMDGDGSVQDNRRARFHTTSPHLAADVQQLVWSLGGVARIDTADRTAEGKPVEYTVKVWLPENPFSLPRKADRYAPKPWYRAIESIEPVEPREMMCIKVDADDELYVVQDHIVTHNTRFASYFPRPIYADCEAGLASVADRQVPYGEVKTSQDMLDLLEYLKLECRLPEDKRTYDTIVIDTLDAYQRKLKAEWMDKFNKDSFTGWEAWGFVNQKMNLLMTRLLNLDMNVVVNVHFKDKVIKDDETGRDIHSLMLQLSGELADTAFNDFDLVGWMGVYWEVEGGERIRKRGITFTATPDKPFLKDRLHVTPTWLPIEFAPSDYENLFKRINARLGGLESSTEVGEIPSADPDSVVLASVVRPADAGSGALPPQARPQVPLTQLDKPTLQKMALDLGIKTLPDGSPIKGNTLKGELVAAVEHHRAKLAEAVTAAATLTPARAPQTTPTPTEAAKEAKPEAPAPQPAVVERRLETTENGVVDTATGELIDTPADGPPAALETVPPAPEAPAEPTAEQVIETAAEILGAQVIADEVKPVIKKDDAPAAALNRAQAAVTSRPAKVCSECGKDLAADTSDGAKLSYIKFRRWLCGVHFEETRTAAH